MITEISVVVKVGLQLREKSDGYFHRTYPQHCKDTDRVTYFEEPILEVNQSAIFLKAKAMRSRQSWLQEAID